MQLTVLQDRPVLGKFDKGIPGSTTLSFCSSAGVYCETSCRFHPDSTDPDPDRKCYAVRTENRPDRGNLKPKLERNSEVGPETVTRLARLEIERKVLTGTPVPWFRISTFGSAPGPEQATPAFIEALKDLLEFTENHDIPTHFPVESEAKAQFYREQLGWRAVVRESCQNDERFLTAAGAVSVAAGHRSMSCKDRLVHARNLAKLRTTLTGRKAVICPAVAAHRNYLDRPKASQARSKCGNCTACAQPHVDVIYPLH